MGMGFNYIRMDQTAYADALNFQEALFKAAIDRKNKGKTSVNHLIFLEHSPVYTLGKSGDEKNLKVPVEETDAEFYRTNRGGDITYHGPGQLTGYPIFDLSSFDMGVKQYVETLEECIIQCISEYGLKGERSKGTSGVWLDVGKKNERKICAVGIKVSRGISMHGFAFNINTDLSYFENIIPCGIENKGVTSLEKELGTNMAFSDVVKSLFLQFHRHFS